ncbi:MAG: hypothetical protein CVU84_11565 [Firmicutes bacterium HGW-Firmicutes-1]|jgi:hypothetical protein|nr:MAG: hypothetical protein CVU84_11565 [Firmicutes bacterium HGW-Firmicutes-1]
MEKFLKLRHLKTEKMFNKNLLPIAVGVVAIVITLLTLFSGENVGLSDNGDYPRFAHKNNIYSLEDSTYPFYWFYDQYEMDIEGNTKLDKFTNFFKLSTVGNPYYSPHFIFLQLSKIPNTIYNKIHDNPSTSYHIGGLAIIYIFLYALALFLIINFLKDQKPFMKFLAAGLLLIIFCDQGYTLYFNSFYGEAAQLVISMLTIGIALQLLKNKGGRILIICYYISVVILAGSKFTNIPIGAMLGIIGLLFIMISKDKWFKYITVLSFIVAVIGIVSLTKNIPTWMDDVTNYQSVFFGVLKDSETPEQDLMDLDLNPKYAILANTHAYLGNNYPMDVYSEEFKSEFYGKVSKTNILKYYLSHPERFIEKLKISAVNSGYIKPAYLGNYGPARPRFEFTHRFELWSKLRLMLRFDNFYVIIGFFLLAFILFINEGKQLLKTDEDKLEKIILLAIWVVIVASTAVNFVVPIIGNGEADLAKHMFGFIHYFDLMALVLFIWIISILLKSKKTIYLSIGLVIIVFVSSGIMKHRTQKYSELEVGAYVQFGQYEDKDVIWQIIQRDDTAVLLFSREVIEFMPFDQGGGSKDEQRKIYGNNFWKDSYIRNWLNKDFLNVLTKNKSLVLESENISYLTDADKNLKEGGTHAFYWTFIPAAVDWGHEEAYNYKTNDQVFLLDAHELKEYLVNNNLEHTKEEPYWLRTPMGSNPSMVRYVATDGYIFHKDAIEDTIGLAPALRLSKDVKIVDGEGSGKHPFIIQE